MVTALVLVALSQVQPGPLDGFRANYASMKAEVDFDYTEGDLKPGTDRPWNGGRPAYAESADSRVTGRWACDGTAEYFHYSSTEDVLERASKDKVKQESGKVYFNIRFVPKTEAIWNGQILCGHVDSPHSRLSGVTPAGR